MNTSLLLLFVWSSLLVTVAPGPDLLMVIQISLERGWKMGFRLALGLCTGLVIHTLLVATGLGVLLDSFPSLILGIKIFGVSYFLFLAYKAWNSKYSTPSKTVHFKGWLTGFIMNLTNPKVFIFFLGFLPQFLFHETWSKALQLSVLGGLFILQALLVFLGVSYMSSRVQAWRPQFLFSAYWQTGLWLFFALWILIS